MIFSISFLNPISNEEDYIKCNTDRITYDDWKTIISKFRNNSIDSVLDWHSAKLKGLNHETDYTSFSYEKNFIIPILYYILRITNPFVFNKIIRKIINVHKENIVIYENEKEAAKFRNIKPTKKKSSKAKNKFYQEKQYDIFGNLTYIYTNPKTGEVIQSDDPNLLETLNAKHKKTKVVSLDNMTFSFKKK